MGETASLVITLIEKLKEPVLKEAYLLYGVANKVDSLRGTLEWIKAFLKDAETWSNQDERFKLWVEKLRDVAYRIEDAIDIYVVQIKQVRMLHSGCISRLSWRFHGLTKKLVALHKLGVELADIEETLVKIKKEKEMFQTNDGGAPIKPPRSSGGSPSLGYLTESTVGLENDNRAIVSKLLDPQAPQVISIVGPGGLGKTTLANKVFNSADVNQKFDLRIWLSVSQEPDMISILKKMLQKIKEEKQEEKGEDERYFIEAIKGSLKNKRFLIVFDDVWPETPLPPIDILCPPDNEMDLSRVLITTRSLDVAQKARSEPYVLRFLTEEESKTLLFKRAFPRQEPPEGLDEVATEIAKGCGGLPLALVVTGGRLYMKHNYSEWRKMADGMVWRGSECMNVLTASYDNLPINLKSCFMYLALFPEDYEIDAKSLVRTWVAEDLVADEESAEDCLQELAQRCLIIVRETSLDGSVERFCVHDLLLELAIEKAKEQKFLSIFQKQNQDQIGSNNARRATLQSCSFDQSNNNFVNTRKVRRNYNEKLRSLLVFDDFLPYDLSGFKLLKVLKVHGCYISFSELEKWCEELIHLRHLELRDCSIGNGKIPESIGHLKNLLTLDCSYTIINELPDSLWRVTTLRHVVCSGFGSKSSPVSADLPNLKTLRYVELDPPTPSHASYHFPKLCDLDLNNPGPWLATLLKELHQLVSLEISDNRDPPICPLDVVDMKAFPFYKKLQCLILYVHWPENVFVFGAHLFPPHLVELELWCSTLKEDLMLELDKLKNVVILKFCDCKYTGGKTLTTFASCLPQLRYLFFAWDFEVVEEFIVAPGAMPMLQKLFLKGFEGMKNIPELQHLKMLHHFEWIGAPYSEEEIQAMRDENQHKLQHIPQVEIRN